MRAPVALLLLAVASLAVAAPLLLEEPDDGRPVRLGPGWLSTEANDYNLSMDADARLMVFGRSSRGDFHDARIWAAARDGRGWSVPVPLAIGDGDWRDSDPWLTPDGRWLYFVSNRPAPGRATGRDDLDLWRAPLRDGRPGTPEHLAAASSPGEELGPEVHGGALVFNSTRSGGPAALALYRSPLVDGLPSSPVAMPPPFNDGLAQGDLTFSADGRIALFWSIRGGQRDPDLFAVRREGTGWSDAVRLPAPFNAPGMDFTPAFSADSRRLRWASQRRAGADGGPPDTKADLYSAPVAPIEQLWTR